jgi:hypothetical protein
MILSEKSATFRDHALERGQVRATRHEWCRSRTRFACSVIESQPEARCDFSQQGFAPYKLPLLTHNLARKIHQT